MKDKILSVVIPAYNMEKYLDECIGSITRSEFIDSIEIIVVNDGSKDDTSRIAHDWELRYPQSVRVADKENGGHGSAINLGARICVGKFFKILDADDWFDSTELDRLIKALDGAETDCVVCDYVQVFEASSTSCVFDCVSGFESGSEIPLTDYVSKRNLRLHSVTYKTECYRNANITVREKCFFDDAEYCLYAYAAVKNVVCYPFNVYQYRLQREGQSVSPQGFLKHLDDHKMVVTDLCEFSKSVQVEKTVKESIIRTIGDHIQFCYGFIAKYGSKEQLKSIKLFDKKIKAEYPEVYKNMKIQRGGRVLKLLGFGNFGLLKLIRKLFIKNCA